MDEFSDGWKIHEFPKQDREWKCYLFGSKDGSGIVYHPAKGNVPNFFIRWMMKICLGCTWVKTPVQSDN